VIRIIAVPLVLKSMHVSFQDEADQFLQHLR
jgi:hypothetical protein